MGDNEPTFPLKVTFDDGEVEFYSDIDDIELNLEDFDSEIDSDCRVEDARGRPVFLRVKFLNVESLYIDEP